jgi:hypothetical protein
LRFNPVSNTNERLHIHNLPPRTGTHKPSATIKPPTIQAKKYLSLRGTGIPNCNICGFISVRSHAPGFFSFHQSA